MKERVRIVKIGGNVINNPEKLKAFLDDFSNLYGHKILVHGGGRKATQLATALGIKTKMIGGRRVTDEEGLEVVTMVYAGLINKKIVAALQANGCNALGLSGADANVIKSHKRVVEDIDYGFAGDIDKVESHMIGWFLEKGICPVFSAITHDKNGQLLNTNADTIASELAIGLSADYQVELLYCFEKKGVLRHVEDASSVIEKIDRLAYLRLKSEGIIAEGMLPKLENCFNALNNGVSSVKIGLPEMIENPDLIHTTLSL